MAYRSNGTPRGLSGPELERVKPAMNAAHGHALGAAALLVAAARSATAAERGGALAF